MQGKSTDPPDGPFIFVNKWSRNHRGGNQSLDVLKMVVLQKL